jgi:vacuolar-type H+-ATPase subunit F/Vma7
MKVRLIARPESAGGIALAGLDVLRAPDAAAAADAIARAAAASDVAIVLVDEVLYHAVPRELRARWDRQAIPVVVPIPGPAWERPGAAEAYILDILRQAIGYRVRPR